MANSVYLPRCFALHPFILAHLCLPGKGKLGIMLSFPRSMLNGKKLFCFVSVSAAPCPARAISMLFAMLAHGLHACT